MNPGSGEDAIARFEDGRQFMRIHSLDSDGKDAEPIFYAARAEIGQAVDIGDSVDECAAEFGLMPREVFNSLIENPLDAFG